MAAAKKVEGRIKHLREQAFELMSAEKYDRAVTIYEQLTKLDETNGDWARRAADCHWHLKNPNRRLKFSLLAAQAYSEGDLMLKAIAMCKVALSIDPNHQETQEVLSRLQSRGQKKLEHPHGVTRHVVGSPLASKAAGEGSPARRGSLRPTTPLDEERKEERTRARMAAAAALRQARAQRRKEDVAQVRQKREDAQGETPTQLVTDAGLTDAGLTDAGLTDAGLTDAAPKEEQRILVPDAKKRPQKGDGLAERKPKDSAQGVLGRLALKPMIKEVARATAPVDKPVDLGSPPRLQLLIPPLHLEAPRDIAYAPTLASLRLSERVPARNLDSLPPARDNVYSLTLADIPSAELTAARVPNFKPPRITPDDRFYVAIIPPSEEEPPPSDSLDTVNISFGAPLSGDRLEITKRDFAGIPLLSDLAPDVLRQLITDMAMIELETNEVLFTEGDPADSMYVVVEGSVTAVTLPHGEKPIQLAHLFEGDFFGEIGLMSDQPRGATVSAHEPTRLLRFDRDIVAVLIEQDPNFLATLLQFLKDRLVEDLMMSSPLFAPFTEHQRYDLAELFEFLEIEPDSVLLERGQHPIGMYVVLTGEATMKGASEAGTIRRLGPGDVFGEQALLSNEVSKVEVRTSTKCFALCLPSDAFPDVIMSHPTVLEYLSTLSESSKGELDVAEDFLDHVRFF